MNPSPRHTGRLRTAVLVSLSSFLLLSCEEVIDLDLDQVPQRFVIEGIISDKPSTSIIILSFSESIYTKSAAMTASGAKVILSDNTGHSELLQEVQAGVFVPATSGVTEREYQLSVIYGGVEYTASSRMPLPMVLDSVRWNGSSFFPFLNISGSLTYYLSNRPGRADYCLIKAYNLNDTRSFWTLYSDKYSDGKQVVLESPSIVPTANALRVEVLSIDQSTYEYFHRLQEVTGSGGFQGPDILRLSDFNPKSNLSNDALGYFSAQTQREYMVNLR